MYAYFLVLFPFVFQWPRRLHAQTCATSTVLSFNVKYALQDRSLEDRRLLKVTTVEHDSQCFSECSKDCRCMSFDVCGKTCQLNGGNRFLVRNSLRIKPGCRHYDFPVPQSICGTQASRPPGICCARMTTPCFNGGSCYVNITDTTRRFACRCHHGFYGDQCEIRNPKTCLDYWTGPLKPISREYTMVDSAGNPYEAFCDFDSEDDMAWTLVESFSLTKEPELLTKPFTVDYPLNEKNFNWDLFRLSQSRIQDIRFRSVFWRGTCSYPSYGVDFRDYVRVRLSVQDPTVFLGGVTMSSQSCIEIDYLDYKGTRCINCSTTIFQLSNEMIHIAPYWGRLHHDCGFDSADVEHRCPNREYARLLGVYWPCSDPLYRCTETQLSTTQIWFGAPKTVN